MTEQQLRTIEERATEGAATAEDALLLVAEVRMLRKLVEDMREDMRSLRRVWDDTRHQ